MTSYFDRVAQSLAAAAERRAHRPWYRRLLRSRHARPVAVILAALVIATPAVAAVSGWFSPGKPNATGPVAAGVLFGVVKPGHSRLLPIRVADPQGGPSWGLRLVRTTRGDTCVQIGRVEGQQLGSLGIDDAWNNDHLFHAIPASSRDAMQCGSTDAVGHGYLNGGIDGESASVNVEGDWASAIKTGGCQLPGVGGGSSLPYCPAGSARFIFYGLLGPDAVSVTYRRPNGSFATERTLPGVGAYLLVFPYSTKACAYYARTWDSSNSCNGQIESGPSPVVPGAAVKVTYTKGRTCSLAGPSAQLIKKFHVFQLNAVKALLGPDYRKRDHGPISTKIRDEYLKLLAKFAATNGLTAAQLRREMSPVLPQCPAVGWVNPRTPKVTAAEVATPIHVRMLPAGIYSADSTFSCSKLHLPAPCADGLSATPSRQIAVEWSFKARRAVTNSRSWYEWNIENPGERDCDEQGSGGGYSTYRNIPAGHTLKFSEFFEAACSGTYKITVGFMPQAPPSQQDNGGDSPGQNGMLLVGRASFTIR